MANFGSISDLQTHIMNLFVDEIITNVKTQLYEDTFLKKHLSDMHPVFLEHALENLSKSQTILRGETEFKDKILKPHPLFIPKLFEYYSRSELDVTPAELAVNLSDETGENETEAEAPDLQSVPASDRFVSYDHNSREIQEVVQSLDKLSKSVVASNELYADAEERLHISKEIDYIKEYIEKPRVRVSAIIDFAKNNSLLKFLANQTVSFVVRQDAAQVMAALEHLGHWLSTLL